MRLSSRRCGRVVTSRRPSPRSSVRRTSPGSTWTGRRCCPAPGRSRCPRTRSSVSGTGWHRAKRPTASTTLLTTATRVGDRDEWLFTGSVSRTTLPWLTDHTVAGTVLLPGTALVDLAVAAGRHADTRTWPS
ncbi:hypothetical protein NKG94_02215 [Micromonospora sp. M12]